MIDFEPDEASKAWQLKARTFAATLEARSDLDTHGHFPRAVYEEAYSHGLITCMLPAILGGGGASTLGIALAAEEVAYGDVGVATSTFVTTLATAPLCLFGTPDQQERWLTRLTQGLAFAAYGFSEPEGSSNLLARGASTLATPVDGGYQLTGVKSTITNATVADFFTVFAQAPAGLAAFVVDAGASGVRAHNPYRKHGQRASDTGCIELQEVFVPSQDRLGREGQGLQIAMRALSHSRYGVGAMAVGVARRARDHVITYGHARSTGSGALIEAQDFRFRIARMHADIQAARLLTWRAALEVQNGRGAGPIEWTAMAKMVGADMAVRVTQQAIEMLGASGYLEGNGVEKLARDAKALQIYEGPPAVQQMLIADSVTRLGRVGKP